MKIRNIVMTALAILSLALFTTPAVQAQTCDGSGSNFIDLNGDGFNDNAPDQDGDGIPNGLDEDFINNAQDGTGYQHGKLDEKQKQEMAKKGKLGEDCNQVMTQSKTMTRAQKFNQLQSFNGQMFQKKISAMGGANGSGTGVCDGTGNGSGPGVCDGTGPHGGQHKGGK